MVSPSISPDTSRGGVVSALAGRPLANRARRAAGGARLPGVGRLRLSLRVRPGPPPAHRVGGPVVHRVRGRGGAPGPRLPLTPAFLGRFQAQPDRWRLIRRPAAGVVAGSQPHLPLAVARHGDGRVGIRGRDGVGRRELPAGLPPAQLVGSRARHRVPGRRQVQLPPLDAHRKVRRLARQPQRRHIHGLAAEPGRRIAPAVRRPQRRVGSLGVVQRHRPALPSTPTPTPASPPHPLTAHAVQRHRSRSPVPAHHVHRELARRRRRRLLNTAMS